jgi:hypothetical protein
VPPGTPDAVMAQTGTGKKNIGKGLQNAYFQNNDYALFTDNGFQKLEEDFQEGMDVF